MSYGSQTYRSSDPTREQPKNSFGLLWEILFVIGLVSVGIWGYFQWNLKEGMSAYRAGKYPEATEKLDKAAFLAPTDNALLYTLGEAYAKQGKHEQAVEYFKKALAARPTDLPHLSSGMLRQNAYNITYSLTLSEFALGHMEQASYYSQSLLSMSPDNPEVFKMLGFAYYRLGQDRRDASQTLIGLRYMERSQQLNPNQITPEDQALINKMRQEIDYQ